MDRSRTSLYAWIFCAIIVGLLLLGFGAKFFSPYTAISALDNIKAIIELLTFIASAVIGALIISRQPRNTIGWLLIFLPAAIALVKPLDAFQPQPGADLSQISPLTLIAAWVWGWSWWLLIGPVLLIPLLFPTGKLLSPRWRWVVVGLLVEFGSFLIIVSFSPTIQTGQTMLKNPLGWLPEESIALFLIPFQILLITITAFCVAAIFIRYRRAVAVEREQIKWLFYVYGIFLIVYVIGFFIVDQAEWYGIVLNAAFLSIPLAIGLSILRYRLWDIDILIRRTISYAILTVALGLLYFGSVIMLQGVLGRFFAGGSQAVIVLSTLLTAALFTPLRRRIQAGIDRRFYRQKYDAARAMAEFSTAASREVELERLTGRLVSLVDQTVQPESVWLWVRAQEGRHRTYQSQSLIPREEINPNGNNPNPTA